MYINYKRYINKDDNIHKGEALKWKDKRTFTLVECQNLISGILKHKSNQNSKNQMKRIIITHKKLLLKMLKFKLF